MATANYQHKSVNGGQTPWKPYGLPMEVQKIDEGLSRTMATMGLVCAILVVMIHAGVSASGWQEQVMRVVRGFTRVAVPWFFLASGFFLARHVGEDGWYQSAVIKRMKSLLVPFFCWLIIYRLLDATLHLAACVAGRDFGGGKYYGVLDEIIYLCGIHPLRLVPIVWFLRALFFLVLLSPLFCVRSRRVAFCLLSGFLVAYAWHEGCPHGKMWSFFEYFFPLRGLFWFFAGMMICRFGLDVPKSFVFTFAALVFGMVFLFLKTHALFSGFSGGG